MCETLKKKTGETNLLSFTITILSFLTFFFIMVTYSVLSASAGQQRDPLSSITFPHK